MVTGDTGQGTLWLRNVLQIFWKFFRIYKEWRNENWKVFGTRDATYNWYVEMGYREIVLSIVLKAFESLFVKFL